MGCTKYLVFFLVVALAVVISLPSLREQELTQNYASAAVAIKESYGKMLNSTRNRTNGTSHPRPSSLSNMNSTVTSPTTLPDEYHQIDEEKHVSLLDNHSFSSINHDSVTSLLAKTPKGILKSASVVLFLAVPGHGAVNLIQDVGRYGGVRLILATKNKKQKWARSVVPAVNQACSTPPIRKKNNMTNLFKITRFAPSFLELDSQLRQWRSTAERAGVPFFVFAMLNDSLSLSVDYFNIQYRSAATTKTLNPSAKWFLDTAQENPLCSYFAYSFQYPMRSADRNITTAETCNTVLRGLREHVDWVGTTDNFAQTVTIVKHLFEMPDDYNATQDLPFKPSSKPLKLENLDAETIQEYHKKASLDDDLYQIAQNWQLRLNSIS